MEHLSAEERACLTYLEETIEALEVQEDGGWSRDGPNDEAAPGRTEVSESGSGSAADGKGAASASLDLASQHGPSLGPSLGESLSGSTNASSATKTKTLDGDGETRIVASNGIGRGLHAEACEVDLDLIPPPSDFMDERDPPAQQKADLHPPLGRSTNKPRAPTDLELVSQRASEKRPSLSPPATQSPPEGSLGPPDVPSGPAEPRSPPVVPPKPRKLPSNIVLKPSKVSAGPEGTSSSDRVLLDPQKIRLEALRKLGLLTSEEAHPGCPPSPKHSPQTRRSWPAPPSEVRAVAPHTPAPASTHTPAPASTHTPAPASTHTPAPAHLLPDILPAPAAFSDPVETLALHELSSETPPLRPPVLTSHSAPPKVTGVKSATLERSGLGLSAGALDSSEASEGSLGGLRNSRPRPASLGSRQEFSGAQGDGLQRAGSRAPDPQRPPPGFHHLGGSHKPPRTQGISVLICPRAENGEDRRNALKKLGLLRD